MGKSRDHPSNNGAEIDDGSSDSSNEDKQNRKIRIAKTKLKRRKAKSMKIRAIADKTARARAYERKKFLNKLEKQDKRDHKKKVTIKVEENEEDQEDLEEDSDNGCNMSRKEWEKQQSILKRVFDKETTRKREMVLIVHGFMSDVAALQFEWAWQNPHRSRILRNINVPNKKNTKYETRLRVLWNMLRMPPWCRLPLTVRWLSTELCQEPYAGLAPPAHMPIVHGAVVSKKMSTPLLSDTTDTHNCSICKDSVDASQSLTCLSSLCDSRFHIVCLAEEFISKENVEGDSPVIPVEGPCPTCNSNLLWGDIIRKQKGLHFYSSE